MKRNQISLPLDATCWYDLSHAMWLFRTSTQRLVLSCCAKTLHRSRSIAYGIISQSLSLTYLHVQTPRLAKQSTVLLPFCLTQENWTVLPLISKVRRDSTQLSNLHEVDIFALSVPHFNLDARVIGISESPPTIISILKFIFSHSNPCSIPYISVVLLVSLLRETQLKPLMSPL